MYQAEKMRLERINSQAEYIKAATAIERGGTEKGIREWAVTKIKDEKIILAIIESEPTGDVIAAAIETLQDWMNICNILFHSKRSVARRYAAQRLNDISPLNAQTVFVEAVKCEKDPNVCKEIINFIYSQANLSSLFDYISNEDLRRTVVGKLESENILLANYRTEKDPKVRRSIIERTKSAELINLVVDVDTDAANVSYALQRAAVMGLFSVIEKAALNDQRHEVRHTAVGLIKDPDVLKQVLLLDKDIRVRQRAIQMPQSQDVLENIAVDEDESVHLRLPAIALLEDVDTLKQLRQHTQPAAIREAAARRISALRADGNTEVRDG